MCCSTWSCEMRKQHPRSFLDNLDTLWLLYLRHSQAPDDFFFISNQRFSLKIKEQEVYGRYMGAIHKVYEGIREVYGEYTKAYGAYTKKVYRRCTRVCDVRGGGYTNYPSIEPQQLILVLLYRLLLGRMNLPSCMGLMICKMAFPFPCSFPLYSFP